MVEQQVPAWHVAVVESVRKMEEAAHGESLLAVGATSRRLADVLGVTETTALKYLREVIASEKLVEVEHASRRLLFPWTTPLEKSPERWVNGTVRRGAFQASEFREPGPAMAKVRFVFTPERLKQFMDRVLAEEAEKKERKERAAAELRAKREAEESAEQALFAKHYPVLAGLLSRLHDQVHDPRRSARGVTRYAEEHPEAGVFGRVMIEVDDRQFGVLEDLLSKALGDEKEGHE